MVGSLSCEFCTADCLILTSLTSKTLQENIMRLIYGVLSDFNVTCTGKSITGSGASEYCAIGIQILQQKIYFYPTSSSS